jgi:hypothetical protein
MLQRATHYVDVRAPVLTTSMYTCLIIILSLCVAAEVDRLFAEATSAAKAAAEKQAIAAAKQDVVIRMRARDATLAASTKGAPREDRASAADETSALRHVAAEATVAREEELVEKLKQSRGALEAAEMLAKGRIGADASAAAPSKGTEYLKSKLDGMMHNIEKELESVRSNLDLKKALAKFDKNKDGNVTKAEIDEALRTIAGSTQTQAAAAALIKYLDADRDGAVSVEHLQKFLDEYAQRVAKADSRADKATRRDATTDSGSDSEGDTRETEEDRKRNSAKAALSTKPSTS